ncbi:hypothetical protein ABIE49_008134 [Bradyrhizobium sp. OAE829]
MAPHTGRAALEGGHWALGVRPVYWATTCPSSLQLACAEGRHTAVPDHWVRFVIFIVGARMRSARCRSYSRSVGLETNRLRLFVQSETAIGLIENLTTKLVRPQTVIVSVPHQQIAAPISSARHRPVLHSQAKLDAIARQLNELPRKPLLYDPAEKFAERVAAIGTKVRRLLSIHRAERLSAQQKDEPKASGNFSEHASHPRHV